MKVIGAMTVARAVVHPRDDATPVPPAPRSEPDGAAQRGSRGGRRAALLVVLSGAWKAAHLRG